MGETSPSANNGRSEKRRVTILGSTGSVGCNTVELVAADPCAYEVEALVAQKSVERLIERGTIEVELAQKNMSVQNLRERVQQKYHVNLDDIRSECITITFADEGEVALSMIELLLRQLGATGEQIDRERDRIRTELFGGPLSADPLLPTKPPGDSATADPPPT